MLTHRAILYDESALDLVVFNGLHQPGNCNKTLSEGENPLVVLLLFFQSNSSFKSKLKHAYLDRFSVTVFVSVIYPFLGKFRSCFTIAILAMLLGSSSSISSSQIVWNFLPFSPALVSRVSRSPSLFHFTGYCKRLPNFVTPRWLWRISRLIWVNQKWRNIMNA